MEDLKFSVSGVQFLCSFEGFGAKPYFDPASGNLPITIGYGTTRYPNGNMVKMSDPEITQAQGEAYLSDFVNNRVAPVINGLMAQLTQWQFDALCSLCYNIGVGAFAASSVRRAVLKGDYTNIAAYFALWNKGNGKILEGLVKRRAAEAKLFLTGEYC